ncbi:tRNA adenosine(34) deaminase TadA [Ligilactobacillus ruminis]|uniref:tRNA adenosine(34) deaminase TadA n=1 Tax=Ligilactobacillus ruminis TaxID=1623 RepID=UPI0022E895B6|nr:tRNA adenosine(34) deaminase TadA [Ligilactobacillus ruminis]
MTEEEKIAFMKEALKEAKSAYEAGEVPIGCVIVSGGRIIGRGHNRREELQDATEHAEMIAIREANRTLGSFRLENCALFVTLEPCPMCTGAIINARIPEVFYGAPDEKAGTCGTLMNLLGDERFNHRASIEKGCLRNECGKLLSDFFASLRAR